MLATYTNASIVRVLTRAAILYAVPEHCDPAPPPATTYTLFRFVLARMEHGSTLSAIGAELGVTRPAVIAWIHGRRNPSRSVQLIAARLLAEPRELAPGIPPPARKRRSAVRPAPAVRPKSTPRT